MARARARKIRGQKPHRPTSENKAAVKALSSYGVPCATISAYIGICDETLNKYYMAELTEGRCAVEIGVNKFLARAATGAALRDEDSGATYSDCLRAAMFYGKTKLGLSEKTEVDHTSSDNSMTPTVIERTIVKPKPRS